ncbi:hypothetical protein D3C84_956830 [compost metagenome]
MTSDVNALGPSTDCLYSSSGSRIGTYSRNTSSHLSPMNKQLSFSKQHSGRSKYDLHASSASAIASRHAYISCIVNSCSCSWCESIRLPSIVYRNVTLPSISIHSTGSRNGIELLRSICSSIVSNSSLVIDCSRSRISSWPLIIAKSIR